jgi:hypothetical protein
MIRTMNVQSKLVDGFKSMVLYGNNSDNGNFDTAHHAMSLYAEKITDGWKIGPGQNQSQGHDNTCRDENGNIVQATLEEDPEADLDMAYGDLLDSVTDGSIANVKNAMQSYIAFLNSKKPKTAATLPMNQNILLPFNFSVVIDGFSGFNWGNTIKVDYLPSRYFNKEKNSRIYFQITKVNHEITLNDWATTVETIMRLTPEWADVSTPSTNNQGVPMASAGTTTTTTTNQGPLRQVVDTSSTTGGTNFTPWRP